MILNVTNTTAFNITIPPNTTFFNVTIPPLEAIQPPPPWYVHYLPELLIAAGIISTALTFYLSPELRKIFRRAI
ncbi:hypothetical protein MetMK1DRAFT_00009360 [Metallosphaera yellowstonensis MK1]|uniref:Uncharacterized protein n=1 Tax=Metallosphaera yellowstonensis MK1 TaxID=671065 RepID=H2C2G3_9CREN|nr:hypothetical protein MetMK1DRAFT_00009360 [Metallosphaera yellowstonensis MK1]